MQPSSSCSIVLCPSSLKITRFYLLLCCIITPKRSFITCKQAGLNMLGCKICDPMEPNPRLVSYRPCEQCKKNVNFTFLSIMYCLSSFSVTCFLVKYNVIRLFFFPGSGSIVLPLVLSTSSLNSQHYSCDSSVSISYCFLSANAVASVAGVVKG